MENLSVERINRLKEVDSDEDEGATEWKELAISSILRFGLIAILFFIAQVFVNLYRYLLRIAVFYEACSKAILLASDEKGQISSPETLGKIINTLELSSFS